VEGEKESEGEAKMVLPAVCFAGIIGGDFLLVFQVSF
jgi:hypothetical protein